MNLPDTKNKETIVENDSIEKLEHDIRAAIGQMRGNYVIDLRCREFVTRYVALISRSRQKVVTRTLKQELNQLNKCSEKENSLVKQIISLNLLVLFLFWAELDINSQSSGAILGITISGLEKEEVIGGLIVILLFLCVKLLWAFVKSIILIASSNMLYGIAGLKKEDGNFQKVHQLLEGLGQTKIVSCIDNNYLLDEELCDLYSDIFDEHQLVELIEKHIPLGMAFGVTYFTCSKAYPYISQYYNIPIDVTDLFKIFITIAVVSVVTLFFSAVKWAIRRSKNDSV